MAEMPGQLMLPLDQMGDFGELDEEWFFDPAARPEND